MDADNTVNSNIIGIKAGNEKCGLPPNTRGQSAVNTHVINEKAN